MQDNLTPDEAVYYGDLNTDYTPSTFEVAETNFTTSFSENLTVQGVMGLERLKSGDHTGAELNEIIGTQEYSDEETYSNSYFNYIKDTVEERRLNEAINEKSDSWAVGTLSAIGGGLLDPVSIAAGSFVGKMALGAVGLSRASKVTKIASQFADDINKLPILEVARNELIEGFAGGLIVDSPALNQIYASYGEDFTARDAIETAVLGAVAGAGLVTSGTATFRAIKKVVRSAQVNYGSKAGKVIEEAAEHAELERTLNVTENPDYVVSKEDFKLHAQRPGQEGYTFTPVTKETVENVDWHIPRTNEGYATISADGAGTITLTDKKNLAENFVSGLDDNGGSVDTFNIPKDLKTATDGDLDLIKSRVTEDPNYKIAEEATTINELIDLVNGVNEDFDIEIINEAIKQSGFDAYTTKADFSQGSTNKLVILNKEALQLNVESTIDGPVATPISKLNRVSETEVLPLSKNAAARKFVEDGVRKFEVDEARRLTDKSNNKVSQGVNLPEEATEIQEAVTALSDIDEKEARKKGITKEVESLKEAKDLKEDDFKGKVERYVTCMLEFLGGASV